MKKYFPIFTLIIGLVIGIIIISVTKNSSFLMKQEKETALDKFSGLEKNLASLEKDWNFYDYLYYYQGLLNDSDYTYLRDIHEKIYYNDEYFKFTELWAINEMFKDEKAKNIIANLKSQVNEKITSAQKDKDEIFQKNTACASLVNGIKEQLSKKYKTSLYSLYLDEEETMSFIFFSPTMQSCLYTTEYRKYTHEPFSSEYRKIVYNASNNTKIKDFLTFCLDCSYLPIGVVWINKCGCVIGILNIIPRYFDFS